MVEDINPALPMIRNMPYFPRILKLLQDFDHQPYVRRRLAQFGRSRASGTQAAELRAEGSQGSRFGVPSAQMVGLSRQGPQTLDGQPRV